MLLQESGGMEVQSSGDRDGRNVPSGERRQEGGKRSVPLEVVEGVSRLGAGVLQRTGTEWTGAGTVASGADAGVGDEREGPRRDKDAGATEDTHTPVVILA